MDLKIQRKTLTASTAEKFEFNVRGYEFLVKNFNDFDIYVAFKNTTETDEMIKIPAMSGQVCLSNKDSNLSDTSKLIFASKEVYVYATQSGEVEVQCLKF